MKNDNFLVIQDFKKRITIWRMIAFVCLVSVIFLATTNIFNTDKIKKFNNKYVARVSIKNIISSTSFLESKLKGLEKDEVVAVILDIDSPGGEVVSSERLYSFFRNLAKKKPVVSVIKGLGTSGAYMVAMASDYIVSRNTSTVGSIGVVLETEEITELADKIGIKFTNFKSSPLKASPNMFEKITPDVEMVTNQLIDDIYDYFLSIFIERRNIKAIEAQEIANGQVYTGRQALEFGLVDKIGGEEEAIEYLKDNNINMDDIKIYDYDIKKYGNSFASSIKREFIDTANNLFKNKNVMAIYR